MKLFKPIGLIMIFGGFFSQIITFCFTHDYGKIMIIYHCFMLIGEILYLIPETKYIRNMKDKDLLELRSFIFLIMLIIYSIILIILSIKWTCFD